MRKLMIAATAIAVMTVGSSAAWADCSGATSSNPNVIFVPGTQTTTTEVGDISFSGNSGNGFADITIKTVLICVAWNTQSNNPVPGQNVEVVLESQTLEDVKVCQNVRGGGSTQTPESTAAGYDVTCTP